MSGVLARLSLGLLVAVLAVSSPGAATLQMTPVRLSLSLAAPITAMSIRNRGADSTVLQIEIFDWHQEAGKDVLRPTDDVLVNPPIFQLPAEAEQIVRFGLQVDGSSSVERSYRVLIREVPKQTGSGKSEVRLLLQFAVPLFVAPPDAAPKITWHVTAIPGKVQIDAANRGNAHAQLASLILLTASGQKLVDQKISAYVMPGQSQHWSFPLAAPLPPGQAVELRVQSDQGTITERVIPEAGGSGAGAP